MPEISRFFGIIIRIFFDDHWPPHFHAEYSGQMALVDIRTLVIFAGHLPPRALGLVVEWGTLHREELIANWQRAQSHQPLVEIAPLE